MTQVVDSAQWTGAPSDPFADLTIEERQGIIRFDGKRSRLVWPLFVVGAFAALGILVSIQGWMPLGAPRAATVSEPYGALIGGAVIVMITAAIGSWLGTRLAAIAQTAPLMIDSRALVAGERARKVIFADVTDIGFRKSKPLSIRLIEAVYLRAFWMFRTRTEIPILAIASRGRPTPLLLDLDLLDGKPERIATILRYRVEKARGNANV